MCGDPASSFVDGESDAGEAGESRGCCTDVDARHCDSRISLYRKLWRAIGSSRPCIVCLVS